MKLVLFIMTFFPTFLPGSNSNLSWEVGKESSVSISGSSNVNEFVFAAKEYEGRDTLVINLKTTGQKFVFDKGMLRLPVKNFRNGNPMLNKDFKKILDVKNHPNILMNFKTINGLQKHTDAEVDITLAGRTITRIIKISTCQKNNSLNLSGKETLKFSDFGLQAPKNMLGFINVKNELDVEFCLVLKQLKNRP